MYRGTPALKNSALVGSLYTAAPDLTDATLAGRVDLLNLPTSGAPLTVKVTKAGYTTKGIIATLDPASLNTPLPAYDPTFYTDEYLTASIPPLGKITLVADWDYSNLSREIINLDLFTYIPQAALPPEDVIGNPDAADLFYHLFNVEPGNLYLPVTDTTNVTQYRTRWYHDGGNPDYNFGVGTEAVSMMPAPLLPKNPYWNNPTTSMNTYNFFLTNYGAGGDDMAGYTGSDHSALVGGRSARSGQSRRRVGPRGDGLAR